MCVYARSAVCAGRCSASETHSQKWMSQQRSKPHSTIVRSQVRQIPETSGIMDAQFVSSSSHVQLRSNGGPRGHLPRGLLSHHLATSMPEGCAFVVDGLAPPRLWIYIQDLKQNSLTISVNRCLAALMVDGATISPQAVQVAQDGPLVDEIRYFKAGDRTGALAIIHALKRLLPRLWLRDMSAEYDQVDWVKHGHYELWLASGDRVRDH